MADSRTNQPITIGGAARLPRHLHGRSRTPEYRTWGLMKQRCFNPETPMYQKYGARGIGMCPEWRDSFEAFYRDMGPRPSPTHSIDRIDNEGPYAPWNCRWATKSEQARNRRSTRLFEYAGESLTLAAWSERLGIGRSTLAQRVYVNQWPIERALTEPVRRRLNVA